MQYLMIHDIRREYFELGLEQYRLTFDDGLFSQYYYYPLYMSHPQELNFFITTSFIRPGKARDMFAGRYIPYLKPKKYMYRCFIENLFDHFMTTEEVQELSQKSNVKIGVHSHFHDVIPTRTQPRKQKPLSKWKRERVGRWSELSDRDLSIRSKIAFRGFEFHRGSLKRRSEARWEDYIHYDTESCLTWMNNNLGITPDMYCFPFNEYNEKVIKILKTFGFNKFFAARSGRDAEVRERVDIDSLVQ